MALFSIVYVVSFFLTYYSPSSSHSEAYICPLHSPLLSQTLLEVFNAMPVSKMQWARLAVIGGGLTLHHVQQDSISNAFVS